MHIIYKHYTHKYILVLFSIKCYECSLNVFLLYIKQICLHIKICLCFKDIITTYMCVLVLNNDTKVIKHKVL